MISDEVALRFINFDGFIHSNNDFHCLNQSNRNLRNISKNHDKEFTTSMKRARISVAIYIPDFFQLAKRSDSLTSQHQEAVHFHHFSSRVCVYIPLNSYRFTLNTVIHKPAASRKKG